VAAAEAADGLDVNDFDLFPSNLILPDLDPSFAAFFLDCFIRLSIAQGIILAPF
jgi:hypothetical protein